MTVREEIEYALQESEIMNSSKDIQKIIDDAARMSKCPSNWVQDIYRELINDRSRKGDDLALHL